MLTRHSFGDSWTGDVRVFPQTECSGAVPSCRTRGLPQRSEAKESQEIRCWMEAR